MKKLILLPALMFFSMFLNAQSTLFTFEDAVPSDWQTSNGQLSLTTNHYKEGLRSLCWETAPGKSVLTVSTKTFNTAGRALSMFLRSPQITNDTLIVEFLNSSDKVLRTANVLINFKGWRELIRTYAEYPTTTAFALSKVRFTLKPTMPVSRKLYFDNVNFNSDSVNKNFGAHWIPDKSVFTTNNASLNLYANPVDIKKNTPAIKEIEELNLLRQRLPRILNSNLNAIAARNLINGYKITRNDDGSVKGNVLDCSLNNFTSSSATNILEALQKMAENISTSASDSSLFINMVDFMLDQGFAEGVSLVIAPSDYATVRSLLGGLLNIVPYLPDAGRKTEILKLERWLSEYGTIYYPEGQYLNKFNSDLIYLYLPHYYGYALLQPDDAIAVRELKALKRYLERNTEVVPGTPDIIKIDGTGFHHSTHYNNYMYCYRTWAEYIYNLRETSFNMNTESYSRFREALLATYKMANKKDGAANQFWANSLAGRNPYAQGGINIQVSASVVEGLITASETIFGNGKDEELAAAYNYFFITDKYDVPAKNYDGYYQFNYSPLGIVRKDNWVVGMRAPTSYFWGAEIYANQNRFGRYQSHGTLEVVYTGNYSRSGIPVASGAGGWDWNVVPGTTSVHYTSWREMMPNKNLTDRFDQKASGTNFSGALAAGNCGVFATDFVQGDNWGSQRFTPTNLKFKKSVFTFDSIFVCLGTGISATGNYSDEMHTATNLFQEIKSTDFSNLVINGTTYPENNSINLSQTANNWILTPLGTGYFIPAGNDQLVVKYANQSTPKQDGSDVDAPTTTSTAAKAYIDHGVKPTAGKYHFAMIPNMTQDAMQSVSAQIGNDGGSVYKIESQTNDLHAVTHLQTNTTGYCFFKGVSNIPFGVLKSTTAEHLLVIKKDTEKNRLYFSVCNPNLRPVSNADFGFLSTPTVTTLTVEGVWKVLETIEGVDNVTVDGNYTEITLTMSEGMPIYFTLGALNDTSVKNDEIEENWISLNHDSNDYILDFSEEGLRKNIEAYSINGRKVFSYLTSDQKVTLNKEKLGKGFYLLVVSQGEKRHVFKLIN